MTIAARDTDTHRHLQAALVRDQKWRGFDSLAHFFSHLHGLGLVNFCEDNQEFLTAIAEYKIAGTHLVHQV